MYKLKTDLITACGHSSEIAIDKMYEVYTNTQGVTEILRQIRKDKKSGGHPSLRVSAPEIIP